MNSAIGNDIRKQAKKGIDRADDTTVKMILAMLDVQEKETEAATAFDLEMHRRIDEYENGKIVPLSLDDLESKVRRNHQKRIQSEK